MARKSPHANSLIPEPLREFSTQDLAFVLGVSVDTVRSLCQGRAALTASGEMALLALSRLPRSQLLRIVPDAGTLTFFAVATLLEDPERYIAARSLFDEFLIGLETGKNGLRNEPHVNQMFRFAHFAAEAIRHQAGTPEETSFDLLDYLEIGPGKEAL